MGYPDAQGVIQPVYPWLNKAIILAILFGYCSVIMVTLLGQSRVFLSMSRDGLLPPFFSKINPRFRTPVHSNALFMVVVSLLAGFIPAQVAGEMTSIGTLLAFTLVCAAILVVRKTMPHVHRAFKTPFVPFVPIMGILTCLCMMSFLPADTWIRLVLWMLIGLDVYASYGIHHSKLEPGQRHRKGYGIKPYRLDFVYSQCDYRIVASANRRMGRGQDLAYHLLCLCLHSLRFLPMAYLETPT